MPGFIGRTEKEVAADVIAMLLRARVIPNTASALAAASLAVRVPMTDIKAAYELQSWRAQNLSEMPVRQGGALESAPPSDPTPPSAQALPRTDPGGSAVVPEPRQEVLASGSDGRKPTGARKRARSSWNEMQLRKKEPRPGIRICTECGPKPKSNFKPKDKTGKLRSKCDDCFREYQNARYLSTKKMKQLGITMELVLTLDDEVVGMPCETCGEACEEGQAVVATNARLHHSSCIDEK